MNFLIHFSILAFLPYLILAQGGTKNGDATYYNLQGYTACGEILKDTDMVAAIGRNYFTTANPNNDPICKKIVEVHNPRTNKYVRVAIKDKCMGCTANDIDLSPEAFKRLGESLDKGRFKVSWRFVN